MDEATFGWLLGGAIGGVIGSLLVAVVGLVVGGVAKPLMPGKDPGAWLATILLGIAGSWIGRPCSASAAPYPASSARSPAR